MWQACRKRLCGVFNAGSPKRERAGDKRRPGRPEIHGLYSKRGKTNIVDLMDEVRALGADLDDTDQEMVALKAVLWHLLEQAETYGAMQEELEARLKAAAGVTYTVAKQGDACTTSGTTMTLSEAREFAANLAAAAALLTKIDSWGSRLADTAVKVIAMVKARAETKAKLAEARAVEYFVKLVQITRNIIWDVLPDAELLDVFEDRVYAESCG